MTKDIFGILAIALTFLAFWLYIRSIRAGNTKPHIFSWLTWSMVTMTVFFAQLADGGGLGAWPIGISGILTFCIAVMAYQRRGAIHITRSDWFFFLSSLSAIPLWILTSNPLWAVLLLTAVDAAGFMPTLRKSYHDPHSEPLSFASVLALRNATSIVALEHYSLTTITFPAVIGLICIVFVAIIIVRRNVLSTLQ
jgi:hypothetical protein